MSRETDCTYRENNSKFSSQKLQTQLLSIKFSLAPSLTPPVQAMGVCQSTFGMWFLNADIIIHPMATWLFHNDSAGSTLISVGGFGEGCADPPFTPVLWLHARPRFLKTPSQRNQIRGFMGSSGTVFAKNAKIQKYFQILDGK